jgi:hypothetical protein
MGDIAILVRWSRASTLGPCRGTIAMFRTATVNAPAGLGNLYLLAGHVDRLLRILPLLWLLPAWVFGGD